jgi:hypothetical protein
MKHLGMLGLAAIAALGLMAFVGAGTASATTLATDSAGTIRYPVGTEIHVTLKTGASAVFQNTSRETIATCTQTTILMKTNSGTGTWVSAQNSVVTQSGCSQTTDTINAGGGEIMRIGTEDKGTVVGKNTNVTLNIFGVSCTYGTGEGTTLGTITGGEAPEIAVNTVLPRTAGGFICPSSGIWIGQFVVTSPHALHFVE